MIVVDLIRSEKGAIYARLSYNPDQNYLIMKWLGPCTEDQVKEASMKMLEWQKYEGVKRNTLFHVHDTKELEGAWAGLVEWISNYFFPLNYQFGLRYNLSIVSPDLFSKMASIQLEMRNNDKVTTILCESISDAERVIRQKRNERLLDGKPS